MRSAGGRHPDNPTSPPTGNGFPVGDKGDQGAAAGMVESRSDEFTQAQPN
jgi:hypothetical protein